MVVVVLLHAFYLYHFGLLKCSALHFITTTSSIRKSDEYIEVKVFHVRKPEGDGGQHLSPGTTAKKLSRPTIHLGEEDSAGRAIIAA